MKRIEKPGSIIRYQGMLCEVTGIAIDKVLFIREIGAKACDKCGHTKEYSEVENSRNFQERAEAVNTLLEH